MERTVDLELDPSTFELGEKNEYGQSHRQNITRQGFAGCVVNGKLTAVHYGNYVGKSAALIRFNFTFHGSRWIRYKSAKIVITFASLQKTTDAAPVLCDLFPTKFDGDPVLQTTTDQAEISFQLAAGLGLPGLTVQQSMSKAQKTTTTRVRRMKIEGTPYHDDSHSKNNMVVWSIYENPANKDGIPHQFSCAAIVHHHCVEFQADVKVTVSTDTGAGLIGRPWRKDDPIYFDCSVPQGVDTLTELVGTDLSELKSTGRWQEIVQLMKE